MQAFHPSSLHSCWCCEYTSRACWPWQRSDSHNPSQKIGPSSLSPGRARPSPPKTLIDLMDLCAVHTPSPNKQACPRLVSAETKRRCPPSSCETASCERLRKQLRPAKLANFTAGPQGRLEFAVRRFIMMRIRAPTPNAVPAHRSTRVD